MGFFPCPACGSLLRRPLFDKHGFRYVACRDCGLAHLDPVPTETSVRDIFRPSYFRGCDPGGYIDYERDEALHRRNAVLRLDLMRRVRGRRPGALLDVGCAHGYFLDEARSAGWRVAGVEIADEAARVARTRFRIDVFAGLEQAADAGSGAFDVVTIYQALEHTTEPDRALRLARRCLRPGGTLLIETWDRRSLVARLMGRWWQDVAPPSVIWLFDRRTLPRLFAGAGLCPREVRRTSKFVRLDFAGALLAAQDHGVLAAAGKLLRSRPLRDRAVRYRLGDLVTAIADAPRRD